MTTASEAGGPQIFRYIKHSEREQWEQLGWTPRPEILEGTHHGDHAIVMEWTKEGECPTLNPTK
jgi:hypothetical protein